MLGNTTPILRSCSTIACTHPSDVIPAQQQPGRKSQGEVSIQSFSQRSSMSILPHLHLVLRFYSQLSLETDMVSALGEETLEEV